MAKNDFDIDFDFEKEYGIDPTELLNAEEYDETMEFSDEDLGFDMPVTTPVSADEEFDPDDFLNSFLDKETPAEEDVDVPDFFGEDRAPSFEESYPEEPTQMEAPFVQEEYYEAPSYEEPSYDEEEPNQEEPEDMDELADMEDLGAGRRRNITIPKINLPKINLPKLKTPNIFTKFYDLYFAPVLNKELQEEPQDPNNPRRRRRKSRSQLFKEVYLPPIIVCVSLVLVLSFTIGSVSNLIQRKQTEAAANQSQISATEDAAALKEQEYQRVLQEAELLASGYNYEAAVKVLESFGDMTEYPELQAKRAEYVNIQNSLVEHKDISTIPNLSFHVLMADPARAFKDADLGGSYNRNFVSTSEFSKILDHLYANGYVLVDFESITGCNTNATGTEQFFPKSIYLPADKKPIMLTETMVNYFAYMIDGNGDGQADAQGDGFASKLVVSGDTIKAEYVDANGQTLVGDYDFVPILETFIAEHPDFSYQGARATLAVCGYEGVFGYRTNTSYIASKGNDYYNNEVSNATNVANKLRSMGYTIACYSYGNENYSGWTANQISADMQQWTQQITPVLGKVDTIVYARASDIQDYTGNAFNVLYTSGFRYFVGYSAQQPWAEINTNYVRQKRLMVTGNSMAWYSNQFNGMFDCAAILEVNTRGNVPN